MGATIENGEWQWDNGEEFGYNKFNNGEPNSSGSCIIMHTNFRWNDDTCLHVNMNFVCERY